MIYLALIFLLIGLFAGAMGHFGVAAITIPLSLVLFLVDIILHVMYVASGRGSSRP